MTTTNGKRRNNKLPETVQTPDPTELVQSTEHLEQLLASDLPSQDTAVEGAVKPLEQAQATQETDTSLEADHEPTSLTETPLSAEELLKQAKQQSKKDGTVAEEAEQGEVGAQNTAIAPKTASSEVNAALTQAAQNLVQLNQEAKKKRIETGILEGLEDAKDLRLGKQLGTLLSLAEAEKTDVEELAQQLNNLRSHTDAQTVDAVTEAIKGLGIDLEAIREGKLESTEEKKPSPLGSMLSTKLPSKSGSFKIL
ncbi:MAG: hypothetical protein PUP93_28625 [Rhizonema sp. NSF051]|nr:hypothetical protein [Rhizonema sp. NSF051]